MRQDPSRGYRLQEQLIRSKPPMKSHSSPDLSSCNDRYSWAPETFSLSVRSAIAGTLILQLLLPAGLTAQMAGQMAPDASNAIAAQPKSGQSSLLTKQATTGGPLTQDEQMLHLLSRFTYGPRPGDVERLKAIGVKTWLDQQMNPQKIDDGALEARLAAFPAMSLPLDQLMAMYPTKGMIKQVQQGKIMAEPGGEAERAIYNDQMQQEKDKKKGKTQEALDDPAPMDPAKAQAILALPPDQRFSALCKMSLPQLRSFRQSLRGEDREKVTEGFTPQQLESLAAFQNPGAVVAAETLDAKLMRDLYTERQLDEVMTDFWLNHFNTYIKKSQQAPYYIASYEKQVVRPRALGTFEDLLVATAMSPAMLNYLDNSQSVGPNSRFANQLGSRNGKGKRPSGLNENYARELMELHTLGVGGGYTQKDVTEVAKVFTGWTVGDKRNAYNMPQYRRERSGLVVQTPNRGVDEPVQPQFDEAKHEPGPKYVLGVTIKENGYKEGMQVLHMLATNPATANFVSRKLAVRFVSDDPPQTIVDKMAKTFQDTHGDIRQVLLTMIKAPEFWTREVYRAKVKTPQDFVVSAVRASGADVATPSALVGVISELGMPIYGMQTPNGYSMKADPWNNTGALVSRMNFALALSANKVPGVTANWPALLGTDDAALTPEAKDAALEAKLLHVPVSDRTRQTILMQISADQDQQEASLRQISVAASPGGKDGKRDPLAVNPRKKASGELASADTQSALAAGLLFGSPEFQRR
jgi:uncharacterized protein (DUF1800 family)